MQNSINDSKYCNYFHFIKTHFPESDWNLSNLSKDGDLLAQVTKQLRDISHFWWASFQKFPGLHILRFPSSGKEQKSLSKHSQQTCQDSFDFISLDHVLTLYQSFWPEEYDVWIYLVLSGMQMSNTLLVFCIH